MNRRSFVAGATSSVGVVLLNAAVGQKQQSESKGVSLSVGGFHLGQTKTGWEVGFDALKLSGMTYPAGSWGWIALNFVQGAVSMIGGQILTAVMGSLLGTKQPDITSLMRELLEQFARLINSAIAQHDLDLMRDALDADMKLARRYVRANRAAQTDLTAILSDISHRMSTLARLGLPGYSNYIQFAALELTLLQDRAAMFGGGDIESFREAQRSLVSYQAAMVEMIRAETEPAAQPGNHCDSGCQLFTPHVQYLKGTIAKLSRDYSGWVPYSLHPNNEWFADSAESIHQHNLSVEGKNLPDKQGHWFDWLNLRREIMAVSTDIGAPIVVQASTAKPELVSRAGAKLRARWT